MEDAGQRPDRSKPNLANEMLARVHLEGASKRIVIAKLENDKEPALNYLDSLDPKDFDSFDFLFRQLSNLGKIVNEEKFRQIGKVNCVSNGKPTSYHVWEFKVHRGPGRRLLAVENGRDFVLTNGFRKGQQVATEVAKAERIFCEHFQRQQRLLKIQSGT